MLEKKNTPGNAVSRITLRFSRPPVRHAQKAITGTDRASRITVIVDVEALMPRMISGPAPHEHIDTNPAASGNLLEVRSTSSAVTERVADRCAR